MANIILFVQIKKTNYWVFIIKMRYSTEPRFRKYGNKIADKITLIGKPKEKEKAKEIEEIYVPTEKRQQIIDDLRLFINFVFFV